MIYALILFLVPTLLFVLAFLYETYLSFRRLGNPKAGKTGYVAATWEVTHTLLVTAVVMLIMMFTDSLPDLASAIFMSTFLAAAVLTIRSVLYCYIFYARKNNATSWVDWLFAVTHVAAAGLLVVTVLKALWFLYKNNPTPNTQFLPYFIPGMIAVVGLCALPILTLYRTKR